ncbi:AAA+ ATPase domain-containing protein [Artemisia annua]|uniref:AAA+ ATPase domain-containing protein n=1 Tax=Artemisia annua TaxID=35608 RepID=A0A2U1MEP8_ARTAN|nr:AAA+ ATPase domain-containing protein [Artemisia annua]
MEGTLEKNPRKRIGDFTNCFTQRIVCGNVLESFKNCMLISLDMGSLVVGAKYSGEFEERLKAVLKEVNTSNGQIGIFINEIHKVVGAGRDGLPSECLMYFRPVGVPTKVIETWVGRADLGYSDAVTFSKGLDVIEYLNREQARLQPFDMALEQAENGLQYLFKSTTFNQKTKHEISLGVDMIPQQLQSSHSSFLSAMKSQALDVMIFNSREDPSPHEIPVELQVITAKSSEQIQVGKVGGEDLTTVALDSFENDQCAVKEHS